MQLLSGKFPPDAVDDTVQHGGGAVYDARAHTVLRAFADQVFRGLKGNGRELGRPPGEGLQRDVDPRQQKAALIGPSLGNDTDGSGGTHVDGDDGRGELFQRRHSVRHNVRPHLTLDRQADIQSCFHAGAHHHRRLAQQTGQRFLHHKVQRRHHAAQNGIRHILIAEMIKLKQVHQIHADLICRLSVVRIQGCQKAQLPIQAK